MHVLLCFCFEINEMFPLLLLLLLLLLFRCFKKRGKYEQILPTVSNGAEHIPPVVFGEDYTYLGRYFNFTQNLNKIKAELIENCIVL